MRRATSPIDDDNDTPAPKPAARPDVGVLAAREALRAAFGPRLSDRGSRGQVVVIVAPGEAWSEVVVAAWQTFAKGGLKPVRLASSFEVLGEPHPAEAWTVVEQREARAAFSLADVERALCAGLQVVVVAQTAGWVPAIVAASADMSAVLDGLTWRGLKWAAVQAAGGSAGLPPEPSEAVLKAITPRHLRLALRRGENAAALLARAVRLADAEVVPADAPAVSGPRGLARVPGLGEALMWGGQLAADLSAYREGRLPWRDVDRGAVLAGPPGTGKTTFARALAEQAGVPLVTASHAEWQGARDGHLGTTLAAMQKTFAKARGLAPCILFIDELDSFPSRDAVRHDHADYVRSLVNGLLAELDGGLGREGVVVIGACNDASVIDSAILRSGRLERHAAVGLPDAHGIEAILRVHLTGELAGEDLAEAAEAAEAVGMSGADCERLVRDARRRARTHDRDLAVTDVIEALGADARPRDPALTRRIAVHEAGHALVAEALRPGTVEVVTVRRHGVSGGHVRGRSTPDDALTPTLLRAELAICLAGRAAEEAVLGEVGSGSGMGDRSDLARATRLAALACGSLGFDAEKGLRWQGLPPAGEAAARWLAVRPVLAQRVDVMLAAAMEEARHVVFEGRHGLAVLAEALVKRETLSGDKVREVLASCCRAPA